MLNKIESRGSIPLGIKYPQLIEYCTNKDDAYNYAFGSGKSINCKCPMCNFSKNMRITNLVHKGFHCDRCHKGGSYPEKFMFNMLTQLNVKFKPQLTKKDFTWCNTFRYDFYIYDNIIIETNGRQHYELSGFSSMREGKTLQEEFERDITKKNLALAHDIKFYVQLDCRKSSLEWIKNSIINSDLPKILSFSEKDIDWEECSLFASSNQFLSVCKDFVSLYSESVIDQLSKKYGLSYETIKDYIQEGKTINIIDDNLTIPRIKNNNKNIINKNSKKVEIFKDNISLGIFNSNSELERCSELLFGTKLSNDNISRVCNGKKKKYKGYTFSYVT